MIFRTLGIYSLDKNGARSKKSSACGSSSRNRVFSSRAPACWFASSRIHCSCRNVGRQTWLKPGRNALAEKRFCATGIEVSNPYMYDWIFRGNRIGALTGMNLQSCFSTSCFFRNRPLWTSSAAAEKGVSKPNAEGYDKDQSVSYGF